MGKSMYELRDMLCEELDKVAEQGELTAGSLDLVDKLTHSIKSIDTILAMEEYEDGYSGDGMMYNGGSSYRGGRGGNSYARGRRGNVRRDSMGRYSRDSYARGGRGGSRGYSRDEAKDELMEHLHMMMKDANDEETRRMVQKWIRQAEED